MGANQGIGASLEAAVNTLAASSDLPSQSEFAGLTVWTWFKDEDGCDGANAASSVGLDTVTVTVRSPYRIGCSRIKIRPYRKRYYGRKYGVSERVL
jgi:hypothetical protein